MPANEQGMQFEIVAREDFSDVTFFSRSVTR
jgi:hypothetical protein